MKIQGQSVYYHYNPRGDVIAMTDKDGQIVASYEYDAWGNVLKSEAKGIAADNPFGYAGYMYEKEIGMYYLIARYYNPDHGVFLSVDPDSGDEDDPVTQTGYTYGDNNPVMMVDPDGHWAYRPWGTTQLWVYDKRTAYANDRGVRAGIKSWVESYGFNFSGAGNIAGKVMPFGIAGYAGWSGSIKQSKQKAGSVKVGNRVGKHVVVNNAKKTATKALIMRGSKALGVYGFLPDAGVFLDGYYKGYKTAYKNYNPKRNSKKSKR